MVMRCVRAIHPIRNFTDKFLHICNKIKLYYSALHTVTHSILLSTKTAKNSAGQHRSVLQQLQEPGALYLSWKKLFINVTDQSKLCKISYSEPHSIADPKYQFSVQKQWQVASNFHTMTHIFHPVISCIYKEYKIYYHKISTLADIT